MTTFLFNRLKNFTFKTREFNFDLPKPMLLADVAVRVLYLSYDPLSPLSRTYHSPTNPSPIVGSTADVIDMMAAKEEEEELGETLTVEEAKGDDRSIKSAATSRPPSSRVYAITLADKRYIYMYQFSTLSLVI